jgi:SAM-dependent methyltransferase
MTDLATRRAAMPSGTGAILDRRTLAGSHRRLHALLAPGFHVLDVGCGTGAITRGIAEAVGPDGRVVGLDVNAGFIEEARRRHADAPGLSFAVGDVYALDDGGAAGGGAIAGRDLFEGVVGSDARGAQGFDIVTAARVLQWLARPLDAVRAMALATRPGGRIVVLDFNHEKLAWTPPPPASMRRFYEAFLAWRAAAGMDNAIADRLPELLARVGLAEVTVTPEHETARRGDPDFAVRAGIWADVAATRGRQMVADGAITERERAEAETEYRAWVRDEAASHTMYLLAVDGRRREAGR